MVKSARVRKTHEVIGYDNKFHSHMADKIISTRRSRRVTCKICIGCMENDQRMMTITGIQIGSVVPGLGNLRTSLCLIDLLW